MTQYEKPEIRPEGRFYGFHHCNFWVSNAKQAASYACVRLGFKRIAYKGLETGDRNICSHVVQQGKIVFVYTSPLNPTSNKASEFIAKHGDAVQDIAFRVDDARLIHNKAVSRGAVSVQKPTVLQDKFGKVTIAKLQTYGDCVHSLLSYENYKGTFLPGFEPVKGDSFLSELPDPELHIIDHVVGNQEDKQMVTVADWYQKTLDFHRFWSVDDSQVHTEYSALRSIVMTDFDRIVKMPLNEPAKAKRKSQIQEYIDYHGGAGVQHIAMRTKDIIKSIKAMRKRGVRFLTIPKTYYTDLRERLKHAPIDVQEDLNVIEELNILIDFDDRGYLLQIFTENVEDRPTLFLEVIQRHNHEGFGAGNFKALFTSIEKEQQQRGNLTTETKPKSKL